MAEWARVVNTTLTKYFRGEEKNIMRQRRLPALLMEKGRVTYRHSGKEIEKRIAYRRAPMTGYADMDTVEFSRQDRWQIATLDWRGYNVSDAVTKKERLMNKGEEAIIPLFSGIGERLKDDIKDAFGEEYYIDGNAAGNTKKMHGIESFMGTGGSETVADGYQSPSDTYAGLSTALANKGGTWTGSWPDGTGDSMYDYYTPVLIDYTDASAWSDGATFALNCVQTIGALIVRCQRSGLQEGLLDMVLMDQARWLQYLDKARTKERIIIDRGEKSKLVQLGFKDVLNQDGVDVTWEYGVPATHAYGINCDKMETMSLQDQLFIVDGPTPDETTKSFRVSVDFFGNTWWNPKFHGKLNDYT